VFSISRGYRPIASPAAGALHSPFDPNFVVLRESDDATQAFGLESTAQVVQSLRNLIMSESKIQPVPPWVGGHEPNGGKLESGLHMALIPLAFVGSEYADGHLMGIGIVLPRELSYRDRSKVLSPILFYETTNQPKTLELKMGRAGVWKIVRATDPSTKRTLRTLTYTAASQSWASVTPALLDRMPKTDRVKEPVLWREEVAGIIARSCRHVGLPDPIAIRVEKTPFFRGSLRAMPGQGGFPQLRKDKFQVHVKIDFEQSVHGPVLIGAGRFRGYGLMLPW
jgi:CRISPR-associated protein Csb2